MPTNFGLNLHASVNAYDSVYSANDIPPEVVFGYKNGDFRKGNVKCVHDELLTYACSSTSTMIDSSGAVVSVAIDTPRIGNHIHNGAAWVNAGLLIESEARTNLLLNNGTLSTQDVTVTAVAHTLHFTGTGTITLTGASTAGPLEGTGTGENNRVSLAFTPTAAALTLTVSGTVTNAQLEIGTQSSCILTAGSAVTRAAQTLTIASANMPWGAAVSMQIDGTMTGPTHTYCKWSLNADNQILVEAGSSTYTCTQTAATVVDTVSGGAFTSGVDVGFSMAVRNGATFVNGAYDGVVFTVNTTPTALPDLSATVFQIAPAFMGNIGKGRVWAQDIGDVGIEEASTE